MTGNTSAGSTQHPLAELDQIIHAPARLMILIHLYVVDSLDFTFLKNQTGMSWGNLSTHLRKLEEAGHVEISKGYQGRKPRTTIRLTDHGRRAFRDYKQSMQLVLDDLPD